MFTKSSDEFFDICRHLLRLIPTKISATWKQRATQNRRKHWNMGIELNWDRETKSDFVLIPLTGSWLSSSCNICDDNACSESERAPQAASVSSGCPLRRGSSTFESSMVCATDNNQKGMPDLIDKWMMMCEQEESDMAYACRKYYYY